MLQQRLEWITQNGPSIQRKRQRQAPTRLAPWLWNQARIPHAVDVTLVVALPTQISPRRVPFQQFGARLTTPIKDRASNRSGLPCCSNEYCIFSRKLFLKYGIGCPALDSGAKFQLPSWVLELPRFSKPGSPVGDGRQHPVTKHFASTGRMNR